MIEVRNISKRYKTRSSELTALNQISFKVNKGEVVGLLGTNGAGKTTLIKCLCGLLEPDEGEILIDNAYVNARNKRAMRYISSVLEGNRNLYWRMTVKENIEYFLGNRGLNIKRHKAQMESLLDRFNLMDKKNELVKDLSRGMQQKAAIIIALLCDTEVLLLDEPTLGLDVESNHEMVHFLREVVSTEKKTILISSHDMNLIEKLCDRIVIINQGKLIADNYVNELKKLFEVRTYLFKIVGQITEEQQAVLQRKLDNTTLIVSVDAAKGELELVQIQSKDFYTLIDIIQENDLEIESVEKQHIDFEAIFLKLIKGA